MAMHILPTDMNRAAKVATYLTRAARARSAVQDGSWLNADGERKGKQMARERIAAARNARLS
jgi:hypothetical protein